MDKGEYGEAKRMIFERLKEIEADKAGNIILLAEIAGFIMNSCNHPAMT